MIHVCLNGKMFPAGQPVLMANNRGYRYGDGIFETMKMVEGSIVLEEFHFERLLSGLEILKIELPGTLLRNRLKEDILQLCRKNNCSPQARVRLSVFRGNGGLYDGDPTLQYLIESLQLPPAANELNEKGFTIDIFRDALKYPDKYSALKSANFLPYTMAAHYARKHKYNDCLILNPDGNIADATIANIFLVKNEKIFTPSIDQGCVAGVMRRHLLNKLDIEEGAISVARLEEADEVFLTNAINGLRWVGQYGKKLYSNNFSRKIYQENIQSVLW